MTPCSTLEQRWSACRARVYQGPPVYRQGFGYMNPDKRCCWWEPWEFPDRRPCTSPRRHQCRAGTTGQLSRGLAAVLCDLHWCQAPIPGRASDLLRELDD